MLSGFYTATSGMLMQQRYLNVLSDNMANSKTPGYRSKRVVSGTFDYELMIRQDGLAKEVLNTLSDDARKEFFARSKMGTGSPIRIVEEVPDEWNQGSIEETGRPYDLALNGEGFFTVRGKVPTDENGEQTGEATEYLTRNGSFSIDEEGYLIMPNVGRVLGEKGEIKVGGSNFQVAKDGTVTSHDGKNLGKLKIMNPDFKALDYMDNACYVINWEKATDDEGNAVEYGTVADVVVIQSAAERSNVDVSREMMLAMEVQRAFQACAKAVTTVDQMNQKAASQIASV